MNKKEAEKISTAIARLNNLARDSKHAEVRDVASRSALNLVRARNLAIGKNADGTPKAETVTTQSTVQGL